MAIDCSFHSGRPLHGGGANKALEPRVGLAVQYISADSRLYTPQQMEERGARMRLLAKDDEETIARWLLDIRRWCAPY